MPERSFIVEDLKTRLDKFLANQLPEISRSQIQREIESGRVEVNGQTIAESKFVVRLNDKVMYQELGIRNQELGIKPTNTPLKTLYNNHGLLIINKPAGMVVHPGAGFKGETLASALLYQFKDIHLVGEEHRPGIVHRLDKDTSGVMLVATTQEMYEYLKNAFAERKIKKEYIALVKGRVEKPHGFIETPIGKSKTDFRKQAVISNLTPRPLSSTGEGESNNEKSMPQDPKEAVTEYKVLEYLDLSSLDKPALSPPRSARGTLPQRGREILSGQAVDSLTLLRVKLHTGRTHQIRVHLASIGHPLIGDELYGQKKIKLDGLSRQFLHAKQIEVQLPDRTWIEAASELSEDLKRVLVSLNSKVVKNL